MRLTKEKLDSFCKIRDKSGSRFYEFSTSWWALFFFFGIVVGCVLWNEFIPYQNLRFDPYPFNGLRTILALMGAIQAPVLLLYSRKSTDYRKNLLEQDFELEKKIFKKIELMESEMKQNHALYLQELKHVAKLTKKINKKRKVVKLNPTPVPIHESNKDFIKTEQVQREILQPKKVENNENISA
ncbi:DUF1003 domain-containing protein [Silvanigrella paludirubra]|jgi:uncharacterized membrane protein|uniref:DUF1003 domain-containing protein n=1 Tax=Silvanigrella paludirubra TaxID=2499159 RepID=A0A6N6VSN6_9BACT|nr:DUF1003 domain-containing protein [Silvanigrella paludirubra]KAB8038990.1 DUF1003 domain-containing protein [Silvanigrella paludirubra]